MKRIVIVLLFILSILVFLTGCFFSKTDKNIKHYLKSGDYIDEYAIEVMPSLDSLPEYKNISYQYYYENSYYTRTMLLVIEYDKDTYVAEKKNLDDIYAFLDHIVKNESNKDDVIIPDFEFSIDNYKFRIIDHKGDVYAYYPHCFGMVATSDEKNSIAYLYFYNQSLDSIGRPMSEFVDKYFPHKW